MKTFGFTALRLTLTCSAAAVLACVLHTGIAAAQAPEPLTLTQTIRLPDVRGRIDHLAIDLNGGRLFVAALGNNSVEVIDIRAGQHLARIKGVRKPQGLAYAQVGDRLFVASAEGGGVDVYAGPSLSPVAHISEFDDADNVRIDEANRRVYVGYGNGALLVIDEQTLKTLGEIRLQGHPESFQLQPSGNLAYVNVPSARQIAVVDRVEGRVWESWPLSERANFPMALNEAGHRLFVATRHPSALLVFDSASSKRVATVPSCSDADDLFVDTADRRIYVICGEGVIDVIQWTDTDQYKVLARVRSALGARTGLYVPAHKTLYVAVPATLTSVAEIRAYRAN